MTAAARPLGPAGAHRAVTRCRAAPLGTDDAGPGSVAELAHDFRSPLGSILVLAEDLLSGRAGPVPDDQRHRLELIYGATLRLCTTATDTVAHARAGDDGIAGPPEPFSLTDLLQRVRDVLLPLTEEKGLSLRLRYPASHDERTGHPLALERVVLNLATNAVKYTASGSVTLAVRAEGPRRVAFAVRDTGPGIPSARLTRLLASPGPDAGLGLAICRRLVTAMGGHLAVRSSVPGGTTFRFTLPLPPVSATASRGADTR